MDENLVAEGLFQFLLFLFSMELKQCNKCKEFKILEEFAWQYKKKGRRQPKCKYCMNEYAAAVRKVKVVKRVPKEKKPTFDRVEWRKLNKGYQHAYHLKRKQEDPIFALKLATRSMISQTFKRACKGHFSKQEHTLDLLGCSFEDFASHITSQFTEGMTLENYGEWHLDHIVPLATATTREDVIRLNHYTNFQPLWAKDNLSKGAKLY